MSDGSGALIAEQDGHHPPFPPTEEINLRTLPVWIRRTVQRDRGTYHRSGDEHLSLGRLWRVLIPDLRRPVFLLGSPRSGTTFLGLGLAALPELSYHFEPVFTVAASRYVYQRRWGYWRARYLYRSVYAWLMRIQLDGHLRFAEKTPRNSFILPFLLRAFPRAQFLHIIRDGRDAALSHSEKPWLQAASKGAGYTDVGDPMGPYPRYWIEPHRRREFYETTDFHRTIWVWRRNVESTLACVPQIPDRQYLEIRYEQLVTDWAATADQILDFLSIASGRSRQGFRDTLSKASPNSVGRWRQHLTEPQLRIAQAEAGSLLHRLGYT